MISKIDSSSSFLTIIYSSIFLVITQILLVKLSPQFFSLFNPLPYLIIGLILRYKDLVLSAILSFLLINILNFFFPERIIRDEFIVFQLVISLIIIIFFGALNFAQEKNILLSKIIPFLNLFLVSILIILYFTLFQNIDQTEIRMFFQKLLNEINNTYGIKENKEIENIFNVLLLLLPSINCLVFLVSYSFNLMIAKFFVRKNNFKESIILDFKDFFTPLWFTIIYILFFITSLILNSTSQIWIISINSFICMSFCYLIEGFNLFNNSLGKIKINIYIKFIIIFLLFLFLGYVLLLVILIIGYLENFKKLKNK